MAVGLNNVARAQKREIAEKLCENLVARAAQGPQEEGLDRFIPELRTSVLGLSTHVTGKVVAEAHRTSSIAELEIADDDVDRWFRHVENYALAESLRRNEVSGPAFALHQAAFPDGLAHIDDPIADENRICRAALTVLRSKEYAPVIAAIELPVTWLDRLESALTRSERLYNEVETARTTKSTHTSAGQDADADWVMLMVQLRHYVSGRARPTEKALVAEGKVLLAPLLNEMKRLKANAATRATLREQAKTAETESDETAAAPAKDPTPPTATGSHT